jgi:hypothetical protein
MDRIILRVTTPYEQELQDIHTYRRYLPRQDLLFSCCPPGTADGNQQ